MRQIPSARPQDGSLVVVGRARAAAGQGRHGDYSSHSVVWLERLPGAARRLGKELATMLVGGTDDRERYCAAVLV